MTQVDNNLYQFLENQCLTCISNIWNCDVYGTILAANTFSLLFENAGCRVCRAKSLRPVHIWLLIQLMPQYCTSSLLTLSIQTCAWQSSNLWASNECSGNSSSITCQWIGSVQMDGQGVCGRGFRTFSKDGFNVTTMSTLVILNTSIKHHLL